MHNLSQKEQLENMVKRPILKKEVGIVRLQIVKESCVLYVTKRINQIIREINPKRVQEYYEVQETILESLDQEHKKMCEDLSMIWWHGERKSAEQSIKLVSWMGFG